MNNLNIEQQLNKYGLILPTAPKPVGNYKSIIISGNLAFISGQFPIVNGVLKHQGKIGIDLSIDEGYDAAKLCALNTLSQINKLENFKNIIKVDGYINCDNSFTQHASILDGASDLFSSILGLNAGHVRSVLGCISLPLDAAVEIIVTVELKNIS